MIRVSDAVSAEHAAFAGHFPGNPMVPGVLLLARVARAAAAAFGAGVARRLRVLPGSLSTLAESTRP